MSIGLRAVAEIADTRELRVERPDGVQATHARPLTCRIMRTNRPRCFLLLIPLLAIPPLASAQSYSVGGTVSVFAGVPNCLDTDQVPFSQLPSATTAAACTAANGASASGATNADLATGSVGIELFTSPVAGGYAGAAGQSALSDTLYFAVAGGIAQDEDLLVRVTFTLDGTLSPDALFDSIYGRYFDYNFNFSDTASFAADHALAALGKVTTTPFVGPLIFSKVVKIRGAFLTAHVSLDLFVPGIYQGSLDFGNTAKIALQLPPGVTFTSESGVFLSAPEPAGTALGVTSLLTLVALRQRRLRSFNAG